MFLHRLAHQRHRQDDFRLVNDPRVGKVGSRVGLGPKPDLALRERAVSECWNDLLPIEGTADLVAFAFNAQFVPDALRDFNLGPDRGGPETVDELVKAEGMAKRTGAHDVIILLVLDPKRDSGHLFDDTGDCLEASGQSEIAENFFVKDEQWKMLIDPVG